MSPNTTTTTIATNATTGAELIVTGLGDLKWSLSIANPPCASARVDELAQLIGQLEPASTTVAQLHQLLSTASFVVFLQDVNVPLELLNVASIKVTNQTTFSFVDLGERHQAYVYDSCKQQLKALFGTTKSESNFGGVHYRKDRSGLCLFMEQVELRTATPEDGPEYHALLLRPLDAIANYSLGERSLKVGVRMLYETKEC